MGKRTLKNRKRTATAVCGLTQEMVKLIGRQMQPRLDQWVIEHAVLFATGHIREASHIGEHGSVAILAVEPEQCTFWWELMGRQIPANGGEPLAQFLAIVPVAAIAETTELLSSVHKLLFKIKNDVGSLCQRPPGSRASGPHNPQWTGDFIACRVQGSSGGVVYTTARFWDLAPT